MTKGILLRDHAQDPRVTEVLSGHASRQQEAEAAGERGESPETEAPPKDVTPESSPETRDVEPESSPGEDEEQRQQVSDKEINFRRLRDSLEAEKLKRETLELELARIRRQQMEEQEQRQNDSRVKQLDAYLRENLPDNFEEMSASERYDFVRHLATKARADEEYGGKDELRALAREWEVMKYVPDLKGKQVDLVAQIYDAAKGALQPDEALAIAKTRHPDLFAPAPPPEQPAAVPASHQVMEPSREGRGRVPPDEEAELEGNFHSAVLDGDASKKRRAVTALMKSRLGKKGLLPR